MNKDTLKAALCEARRFIKVAGKITDEEMKWAGCGAGNRNSGAIRRASMDLTRALADLRRHE